MEDFSKRNMREFGRYLGIGIWGLCTAATVAHSFNYPEHPVITCMAVVSAIGAVVAILSLIKDAKEKEQK